jgi:hypothetical protein
MNHRLVANNETTPRVSWAIANVTHEVNLFKHEVGIVIASMRLSKLSDQAPGTCPLSMRRGSRIQEYSICLVLCQR